MAKFRVGLIGAGVVGRVHAAALASSSDAILAGIADISPAARATADAHRVAFFADAERLLDSVRPDAVIVASNNQDHLPSGLACIARGVPVLVEKPIADTLVAAIQLAEAAERAGVKLLVGHHRRHSPIVAAARQAIADGRLGRITAIAVSAMFLKPDQYFDTPWRREAGGGPILINMIHEIDLLRFLCGEIETVQAVRSDRVRKLPVEDTAAALLHFKSGVVATITLSDAVASPWSWDLVAGEFPGFPRYDVAPFQITGTEASLGLPNLELWRYTAVRGWQEKLDRETLPYRPENPFERQVRHFCAVLRGDEEPVCGGFDAARTLAATLAVFEAAQSGRAVRPEQTPSALR
ncbi:MAG: Gfo/Idh/MocA family protein [Candidatus Binataceae bacterium]